MVNFSITTSALEKINEFMLEQHPTPVGIRIFVYQNESGINHCMNFTNDISTTDNVFNIDGITFIADASSSAFLNNTVWDFITAEPHSGFIFHCT
jgi:Fe-S cluster assembly iron-binding protein IscA